MFFGYPFMFKGGQLLGLQEKRLMKKKERINFTFLFE